MDRKGGELYRKGNVLEFLEGSDAVRGKGQGFSLGKDAAGGTEDLKLSENGFQAIQGVAHTRI